MNQFFDTVPRPLDLFGPAHLTAITLLAAAGWGLIHSARGATPATRLRMRLALATLILLFQAGKYSWQIRVGIFTPQQDLPLQLCGVMAWLSVYGLWSRRRWALRLMYFLGVAGAVQAILTPDSSFGTAHFAFVETMASHGLVVIAGVWAVAVEGYVPRRRDPWLMLLFLHLYAAAIYPLNRALGANYLYLVNKPASASLLDYFPGWPWYLLWIEPIAIMLMLALAFPFRRRGAPNSPPCPSG